ncbi:MAG: hypothetical protein RIT24_1455, partial [Planctomycetota bacterium]
MRPPAGVIRPLPRPLSRSEAAREGVHPRGQYALSPGPSPAAKLHETGAPARVAFGSSREHAITEVHRRRWRTRRRGTHGHQTRHPPLLQLRCGRGAGGEGGRPPPVAARHHASLGRGRGGHAKTLRSKRRDGIRTGSRVPAKSSFQNSLSTGFHRMSAPPIARNACWMSARRSYRIPRRRKRWSHAIVRSTTQRWRPRRAFESIFGRAMRGVIPRARHAARLARERYPLSACSFAGR